MASALLFNTCHTLPSHKHTSLLNLIALHPSFKAAVNQYYQLLNCSPTFDSIIRLGTNYFAFLLPDFPNKHLRLLAQELFESIRTHQDRVTYNNLKEYLLKLCSFSVENIDVANAIAFLELLRSRITDTFIVNTLNPSDKRRVSLDLKLQILDSEGVLTETALAQKHLREQMKHLYFEEKASLSQTELAEVKETEVVTSELKPVEDIIPWGYVCEDYLHQYTNGNFVSKNSYRLRKSKKLTFSKVDYWVAAKENSNNLIRDLTVNQDIFLASGVMTASHLPTEIYPPMAKPLTMARINRTFARKNYLQKLKELSSGEFKFYNILSEYFERDEFNIDELTLTREKLIVQRKENLLGILSKEPINKQPKDYAVETAMLGESISHNLTKFHDQTRTQALVKELQTSLRLIQEEDKNLNLLIEKQLSYEDHILKDTDNAFLQDVLEYARLVPLQLLVIGRPKSGKTTLARSLAKKYSLIYISVESMIEKVFERSKFFEENPPEADEDGNVKDGLLAIEKYVLAQLAKGSAVEEEDVLDLINNQFEKEVTHSRGFILDLPFEYNKYWIETLISNRVNLPKIECRYFTHVLQTDQTEEQWKYFTTSLMEKPQNLTLSSNLDRYLLRKPKPPPEQGEEQPEAQQGQKQPPLVQSNLLQVKAKDSSFSLIEHLTQHLHPHRFIKIQNSFQSVSECLLLLEHALYQIPLPKKIEGNEKELLGVGLEEAKLFRQWSPWGLIDCVELAKDKLLPGKFEFAAEYAGRVFVFDNEINLNAFLNLPRKYLRTLPKLPKTTNICITGPRQSGKKTIAGMLGALYGLKVINVQQILQSVLLRQKQSQTHVPSNFDKRSSSIHLSEGEFKEFSKGGLLNAKDVLPIILYNMGVTLQKKPAGWGVEANGEEGKPGDNIEPQQRKPVVKKTKKKDKNAEEERPKTPPPEDIALKDLIPEINHFGKLNETRGYIMVGYPNNEEQLNTLKLFNIPIDKLIILSDNTEQAPNKNLQKRLSDAQLQQVALFTTAIGPVKQALGEEICKEILIDKTPNEIFNKIRQLIDPFYLKADEDTLNRVCADKQEEGDPIPMGFCGQFCPVSLKNGWLIKGKEEFEAGIQGRRFKFCGQKQLADFKSDPSKYLTKQSPSIAPRIMFMGIRGVGLKTQLLKLNEKYRIPILTLKDTLLQQLENKKNQRKTDRYYNKGFKKPEYDEEGKQLQDPQLLEEAADFDRKTNQIETVRTIFSDIHEIFINANFFKVQEDKVSTGLAELLGEGRRLPELLLILNCDEQKWLERVVDRKAIERELDDIKQKRRTQKALEREQARKKALEAGEEYNEPPEEEDTETPKLQQMIAQKQQALKAQREADSSKLQEYAEAFKSWGVEVVSIKCERQTRHVTDRINYAIRPYIEDRINRWEKNSMLAIERHRAHDFLKNYIVRDSRFGKLNPFTLFENPKPFPLIYKDRLYYLKDEEERDYVMRNPKSLQQNQSIPRDVKFTPILFVIGKPKTGKSTLARNLRDKYGFKLISLQEIVEQFSKQHEDHDIHAILNEVRSGKCISDESMVTLIEKRTALHDCQQGWVLDGLPLNKKQCELLNKKGIVPTLLLLTKMTELDIKKRVQAKAKQSKSLYDYNMELVHSRLQVTRNHLVQVEVYYESRYNNVKIIDGNMSKWGMLEQARTQIEKKVKAKRSFIRDLVTHSATDITHVGLSFNCILHNLSEYLNFCPISYKIRREYVKVTLHNYQNLALFNRKIYAFKTSKQLQDFVNNPDTFVTRGQNFAPPQQIPIEDIHSVYSKFENQGYSMTDLARKQLVRGNTLFGLTYKKKHFLLASAKDLKAFQKNPALYELLKLPDKLPVQFEKKNDLKKIAKRNDCSAFLEHHLSNIMMRCLAQLGYRRPKYPTLGSKESALKFLSINLKAANPNKDDEYRQKYSEKLNKFIKECNYSQEIREELERKATAPWQEHDEENLVKLCEEYSDFMKRLQSTDKLTFFAEYIR